MPVASQARAYLADNDLTDPLVSTLLRDGVPSELVVFDVMPRVHWSTLGLPETDEGFDLQARFLARPVLPDRGTRPAADIVPGSPIVDHSILTRSPSA